MEFDKLKREFIVDQEEYSKSQLSELMNILLKFCKVTLDGQVIITKGISTRKVLKLILSARFIAHAANDKISEYLKREELKAYSGIGKDMVFTVRFNELLRDNFADKKDEKIKAKNILLVERFLKEIEEKYKNE